ncbi:MAG: hypothetical protein ACRD3B_19430 [Candidatus Sulfotelmatobacter sp.]
MLRQWLRFETGDSTQMLIFLGGDNHNSVAVPPADKYRLLLDGVEECLKAASGGGYDESLHLTLIGGLNEH